MDDRGVVADGSADKTPFAVAAPRVSLPKGGGAIRGLGEKFATNPVTGAGAMTVPIATSPGRAGLTPQLALAYDSSAGNGPCGLGWRIAVPAVTINTNNGVAKYDGDADVYVLSGGDDLVPALDPGTL